MIGQTVTWTSQSQGSVKTKTGTVTAIIEPGEDARKYLPAGLLKWLEPVEKGADENAQIC
jgi:hypothetical protein